MSEPPLITLDDSDEEPVNNNRPGIFSLAEAEKIKNDVKRTIEKRRQSIQEMFKKQKRENSGTCTEYFQEVRRKSASGKQSKCNKIKPRNPESQILKNIPGVYANSYKSYQPNEVCSINSTSTVTATVVNASTSGPSTATLRGNAGIDYAFANQEKATPPNYSLKSDVNFQFNSTEKQTASHNSFTSSFKKIQVNDSSACHIQSNGPLQSPERETQISGHFQSPERQTQSNGSFQSPDIQTQSNDSFQSHERQPQTNGPFQSPDRQMQSNGSFQSPDRQTQLNGSFQSPDRQTQLNGSVHSQDRQTQSYNSFQSPKAQRKMSSPNSPNGKKSSSKSPKKTPKKLNSSSPYKHWQSSSQPSLLGRKDILSTGSHTKRVLDFGIQNKSSVPSLVDEPPMLQITEGNYHVRYFNCLFGEVLKDESAKNCISAEEMNIIETFTNMENEVKEFFLRMYTRKFHWHRVGDINYEEKFNLDTSKCIEVLTSHGFFDTDNSALDLDTLLELMKFPEMKQFCKSLGMKLHGSKEKLKEEIIKHSKSQKALSFKFGFKITSSKNHLKEKVRNIIGPCFKLNTDIQKLFRRFELCFRMMFSREGESASEDNAVNQLYYFATDTKIYPSYHIDKTIAVFSCRDDLLRFAEAVELESALTAAAQQKLLSAAEEVINKIRENFVSVLMDKVLCDKTNNLPLSLRRFSAGSSLAYSLYLGLGILMKLDKCPDAINDLYLLLGQQIYLPYYRGEWYNQLVNFLCACGRYNEVAEVILKGLEDNFMIEKHRYDLQCCCQKLKKKKNVPEEVKAKLQNISVPELKNLPDVYVKARALEGQVGRKSVYVVDDVRTQSTTYSSVEETAINYYKSRGYLKGLHSENSIATTLFGVVMWNIIYEFPVPYVFRTPYQIKPLDLDSGEFYTNRRYAIDQRLKIMENWSEDEINNWIREIYDNNKGKTCIVNWTLFETAEEFQDIVHCMGWRVALKICERLAKCYQSSRSGFPDLVLWTPRERKLLFSEVKGQKDRLSTVQKLWLNYLIEIGANAELCLVTTVGGRSLKTKEQLLGSGKQSNERSS